MQNTIAPSQYGFPDPITTDPDGQGLICIGADLSISTLFEAYKNGLFPWFNEDDPICWWCPEPRCIIEPTHYKPSKSLLRNMKKYNYHITVNHAFEQVIRQCAMPRSYSEDTWISEDIIQGYTDLFRAGFGYSIEVWQEQELIGGLYGVSIGKGCFGESMFSTKTDVSKMAFYTLMLIGQQEKLSWIDCQLENDHLISLGATTIPREQYLKSLKYVTKQLQIDWQKYQDSVFSTGSIAKNQQLLIE
ncbi:leucyl/phenylalanyl-tRNA--protein transferase [Acinetobacter rathckeae]|uniref:leucyl/phenylalanyl-tRNA--protein transferase n=1 Tax=Acinetobacter rathckeae TaxID=2605272 RepID=UPI0018A24DCD|nr:leucyl/phenylalanyl-tRNA--protein transferase [Acinetobacter rathckeae]MBF7688531.1 leucyl/phenylalanyl-tRNA--protein transferase [Acinetobacter rathckeae]MBF7695778.1 leucyl/phenylalanyl-tRNA--protein transferase [Acinetobacter rathckeae]